MLLGGLWHGASGHFVVWGAFHGALLVGHRLLNGRTPEAEPTAPRGGFAFWLQAFAYFQLTCIGWLIFRADSMAMVRNLLYELANIGGWHAYEAAYLIKLAALALPLLALQIYQHRSDCLEAWTKWPPAVRAGFYVGLFYGIVLFGSPEQSAFIYFQF
jgi:D-alanyl-lipoteichoic acid acyltransferase DltB (MBOAT superfamily)